MSMDSAGNYLRRESAILRSFCDGIEFHGQKVFGPFRLAGMGLRLIFSSHRRPLEAAEISIGVLFAARVPARCRSPIGYSHRR